MNPRLRTLLFSVAASAVAIRVGVSLAQEEHLVATLTAGLALWAILAWTRGPLAEAWLLGFLVFGYVIGNRGFAQVMPVPGLPVFLGELGLGFVVALVALRGALQRELPIRPSVLHGLLLAWMAVGAGRVVWDVRVYGMLAVRDFATVYYALFFFATLALARHAPSRGLLRLALAVTFGLLPLTGALSLLFPDFFLSNLIVQGTPLIYYKGDLLATYLFAGFLVLLPSGPFNWRQDCARWALALLSLGVGLFLLSRSSMLGLLLASAGLAWSGRWRALQTIAATCASGLLLVTCYSLLQKKDFTQTQAYAIYEAAASIADYRGTHHYRNDQSSNKGDNNRYRLVWWRNVAQETLTTAPVFGLGFGADITKGFFQEYYPTTDPDFNPRSPHNIFVTMLGRMGLVGVVLLAAIYAALAGRTLSAARRARGDSTHDYTVTLHAACWVVLVCACFGVVLEGPMGAIPFWIMLGLAHADEPQPAS